VFEGYVPTATEHFSGEVRNVNLRVTRPITWNVRFSVSLYSLGSCEEQLDSKYAGVFMRGVQHLAFRAQIMGILGLVCFESIAEEQGSLNEILSILNLE